MTASELADLLRACPTLYHMASAGAWPLIQRDGLWSTQALLDRLGVTGSQRAALETAARPRCCPLADGIILRDQKPMTGGVLDRCLVGMTSEEWLKTINSRVYFWLTRRRLETLAKAYEGMDHDVLEIDSAALVGAYRTRIELSPINSGAPFPGAPARRGVGTFRPIDEFAAGRKGRIAGVVELTVLYGVPDLSRFVRRVTRWTGSKPVFTLHAAGSDAGEQPIQRADDIVAVDGD